MDTELLLPRARQTFFSRLKQRVLSCFGRSERSIQRVIKLGEIPLDKFPPNKIRNQKYSAITFLPIVLYQQFKFFLNLYFLIMALSQFIPEIRIGYLYTYWGPLCFVLSVTLFREAVDDISRYRRDRRINDEIYERLILHGERKGHKECVPASSLRVGDILLLKRGQRIPADLILLHTSDPSGSIFIATDQLDGETDWKVRISLISSQKNMSESDLLNLNVTVFAEQPQSDIHSFIGNWTNHDTGHFMELELQHTLWAGCVLESSHATGLVIYTGAETRSVMNNSMPRSKVGQFDLKVNDMTKVLFVALIMLSFLMITLKGFSGPWYRYLCRFILLFSYIIPISLRVNLEVGKSFYAWCILRDKNIDGTYMRSTTIPEELGRVSYLLADKTGTVTKNEMILKNFTLANTCYQENNFHEIEALLTQHITKEGPSLPMSPMNSFEGNYDLITQTLTLVGSNLTRTPASGRQVYEAVLGMALCHNVTPVYDKEYDIAGTSTDTDTANSFVSVSNGGAIPQQQLCDYQAASPDEVALVKWTDRMGISLYQRDLSNISLKLRSTNQVVSYSILHMFPFTSETKCMGIIVQDDDTSEITFYLKGADVVLCPLVGSPSWLEDQIRYLASEGLRTLVFGKKRLTLEEYQLFEAEYKLARQATCDRAEKTNSCIASLHANLQLLSITGVEDRLADDAALTINILRRAGIKIWMLTGDKFETAMCIAKSLHLIDGTGRGIFEFDKCTTRVDTNTEINRLNSHGSGMALIIDGDSFEYCLKWHFDDMSAAVVNCSAVVVARCSPTQKARVVQLLKLHAKGSVCAVGDGGNDVPMIREADIGIGLEGKEGKAAALAGDVSAKEFRCLSRLLLVHGRRSRLRSSILSFFVIHRGLIISTMQAIFSTVFYLSSVSIYQGPLMVGYGTIFTMFPVFSLVLDKDISSKDALENPILYKELVKQRVFSYKLFFLWVFISIFQGGVIMYGALIMFEDEFIHIVAISFSSLIFTEILMAALIIHTWHYLIVLAEGVSFISYICALFFFQQYFDLEFITTWGFLWKVSVITVVSCVPLYLLKILYSKVYKKRQMKLMKT